MKGDYKGYLAVVGGILIHLTIGTLYTWGNLNPYVTSYIRIHSKPSTLSYADTVWVFALIVFGQGISMFLGGMLEKRIGTRLATFVGCLLLSVSVFVSSFTVQVSHYLFLVSYGVCFGLGIGLAYALPLGLAIKWFPKHKGLASGFIVAGTGGGSLVFDQVQLAYLNPQNIKPVGAMESNLTGETGAAKYFTDETVLSRVPSVFMLLGSVYLVLQLIGITLLFPVKSADRDENVELLVKGSSSVGGQGDENQEEAPNVGIDLSPLQMLKTRAFITLWFIYLLNVVCVILVSTLYKTYGQAEVVNDDVFLSTLGSVSGVFNGGGRILWGILADRISFKKSMILLCALMVTLMSTLYLTHVFAQVAGRPLFFIWICLIFLTFSGNYSLFPTANAKTFGSAHMSVNYGLLFTSSSVSGIVTATLSTLLLEMLHSYGVFILCAVISAISLVLALTFNGKGADGKIV